MADTQHRIKLDGEIYIQPRRQKDNFILRRIDGNSKLLFSRKKKESVSSHSQCWLKNSCKLP